MHVSQSEFRRFAKLLVDRKAITDEEYREFFGPRDFPENNPQENPFMEQQSCYPTQIPPHSLIGGPENIKLLFDEALDNRREGLARMRAWEAINLDMAQIASRRSQNAATFDHAANVLSMLAGQTGATMNQAPVGPIRTGAGDTEVQQPAGSVYPPNRNVDQSGAAATGAIMTSDATVSTAAASISASIASITAAMAKLDDAINTLLLRAAGAGASAAGK